MSTAQIIQLAESLPPLEQLKVIDALSASLKQELSKNLDNGTGKRKKRFKVKGGFHLGNVQVDRDEIYADRGL